MMKKFRYAQWDVCKVGVESNRIDIYFEKMDRDFRKVVSLEIKLSDLRIIRTTVQKVQQ